jgi:hypothetical protein
MFRYTSPEPQRLTPRGADVYASHVWALVSAFPMERGSKGSTG